VAGLIWRRIDFGGLCGGLFIKWCGWFGGCFLVLWVLKMIYLGGFMYKVEYFFELF